MSEQLEPRMDSTTTDMDTTPESPVGTVSTPHTQTAQAPAATPAVTMKAFLKVLATQEHITSLYDRRLYHLGVNLFLLYERAV